MITSEFKTLRILESQLSAFEISMCYVASVTSYTSLKTQINSHLQIEMRDDSENLRKNDSMQEDDHATE